MEEATYSIAKYGVATSFTESELPMDFAADMRNIIVNQAGGAEKRQGITTFQNPIPGNFLITGLHSFVVHGVEHTFASAQGIIWLLDETSGDWNKVYQFTSSNRIRSVVMTKKIIFYNGEDRPFYTEDGTTFIELRPIILLGTATGSTSAIALYDTGITGLSANASFLLNTHVAINDLVYNVTLGGYGVVTAVTSAFVSHTSISSAATGLGKITMPPPKFRDPAIGDRYEILDLIELNIIPTDDPQLLDNVGLCGAGTTPTLIKVSGVNFANTDIRVGDYVYNTTEAAITQVTAVNVSSLGVVGITLQGEDDSLIFLKSAMPVPQRAHVHFGRLYLIDSRDPSKMAFSGPDDPQDFTDGSGTIDLGNLQPTGETFKALASFQKYLVILGSQNAFFYEGTDPSSPTTFLLLGTLPQGCISSDGVAAIGNEVLFTSQQGIDAVSLIQYGTQLGRTPLSFQINDSLREALRTNPEEDIILTHYARRSLVLCKIGAEIFAFNYTPSITDAKQSANSLNQYLQARGSWTIFDGLFAQQKCFLIRENGDLLCAGVGGIVGIFDQNVYADYTEPYEYRYQTGWLTMTDPKSSVRQKMGKYIKPLFQAGSDVIGTITVESPFEGASHDTVQFEAGSGIAPIGIYTIDINKIGGSSTTNNKLALRWKGEVARMTFRTNDTFGPLILGRYTVYYVPTGRL